ncbi:hypothetical protein VNO80_07529 [Phaseolus coccineus]|uniref:Uncharacterized protein n=1 Tax=Phaseolus coccineus TaxID=3886 RepID=A0AAN9RPU0_PHACN
MSIVPLPYVSHLLLFNLSCNATLSFLSYLLQGYFHESKPDKASGTGTALFVYAKIYPGLSVLVCYGEGLLGRLLQNIPEPAIFPYASFDSLIINSHTTSLSLCCCS